MNSVCCFSRGARRTGGCSVKVASLLALILKSPKKKEENEENWLTVKEIVLKFIKIAFFAFVINVFFSHFVWGDLTRAIRRAHKVGRFSLEYFLSILIVVIGWCAAKDIIQFGFKNAAPSKETNFTKWLLFFVPFFPHIYLCFCCCIEKKSWWIPGWDWRTFSLLFINWHHLFCFAVVAASRSMVGRVRIKCDPIIFDPCTSDTFSSMPAVRAR